MSDIHLDPVEVITPAVRSNLSAKAHRLPPMDIDIVPLRLVAYDIDSYRIKKGWPEAVPSIDVRARCVVSLEGLKQTYRTDPEGMETNADVRWIANPDFYDQADLIWRPIQDKYGFQWITSPDYAPELVEEYTYQAGNELITRTCLNFDSANRDHFWANFGSTSLPGFTFSLVASLRSPEGKNMGLLCPGLPTPLTDEFPEEMEPKTASLKLSGHTLTVGMDSGRDREVMEIGGWMSKQAPLFIFLVVQPPAGHIYVAQGALTQRVGTFDTGKTGEFNLNYVLGRGTGDLYETADMAVFETGFYASALTKSEVSQEVATFSSMYGGSNTS